MRVLAALCALAYAAIPSPCLGAEVEVYLGTPQGFSPSARGGYEIPAMPPFKDQNGVGLCYAFAATTLAEHYICKTKSCSGYTEDDLLSPTSLSAFSSKREAIVEGGLPSEILAELAKEPLMRKEKCAPFPPLVEFVRRSGGWKKLSDGFTRYKSSGSCVGCIDRELARAYPANIEALRSALQKATFEAFLWDLFVPAACRAEHLVQMPKAQEGKFYVSGQSATGRKAAFEKIEQLILNDIPVLTSICTNRENGQCTAGHAAVLSGIREVCDSAGRCQLEFKVHNSYGRTWQESFQGGWVSADRYLENTMSFHWLEAPNQTFSARKLPRSAGAGPGGGARPASPRPSLPATILRPGEDRGAFIRDCQDKGGRLSFSDSGTRCEYQ